MRKKIILLISLLMAVSGCIAKKELPVPWDSIVPKRILDLAATPREGRVLLEWTAPKENTDKSPLTDLAGFKILRSEGVLIGDECRGCGEKTKVVYEMKMDIKDEEPKKKEPPKKDMLGIMSAQKEEPKKKKMAVILDDQEGRKVYVYQVVSVNRRGYSSVPSNPVTVYWDDPLQAPSLVKAERGDKKVDLSWEPVEGASGYNVFRRLENEEFSNKPLNNVPLTATQYSDLKVENEKRYVYSVRTVKKVVKTDLEGKGSLGVPVTPTDLIPPSAPVDLAAIPLKDGIELNWRRNREPDLLGYYAYRRKPLENEFKRLFEAPLTTETYLDKDVVLGQEYEYAVTAVDNSVNRNESSRSEEVSVKYLY